MSSQDAVYSEVLHGATTVPLELTLEEDVEKEIQHFVMLSRMGQYLEADTFFNNVLEKYQLLTPVIVEYTDMLLEQGRYERAAEFLDDSLAKDEYTYGVHERQLLILLRSLATIYSKGALRSALLEAKRAWEFLELESVDIFDGCFTEVKIHIVEIYVSITAIGYMTSQWVDETWMRCPSVSRAATRGRNGFIQWFCILKEHGLLWEASRILQALQPLMSSLQETDLRELLQEIAEEDCQPSALSDPDVCAYSMISLYQAQFLLNASLVAKVITQDEYAAEHIYELGMKKLELADQAWSMLCKNQSSASLNLFLAFEKICYAAVEVGLSPVSSSTDVQVNLSILLSEAELRQDVKAQVLSRLYILLHTGGANTDWCDLYSMFEMQLVDCGNFLDYVHTWVLFTAWAVDPQLAFLPFERPARSSSMALQTSTLFLAVHPAQTPLNEKWGHLLLKRKPDTQLIKFSEDERLSFDISEPSYLLLFDIPGYRLMQEWAYRMLRQKLLATSPQIGFPQIVGIHWAQTLPLITHLKHLAISENSAISRVTSFSSLFKSSTSEQETTLTSLSGQSQRQPSKEKTDNLVESDQVDGREPFYQHQWNEPVNSFGTMLDDHLDLDKKEETLRQNIFDRKQSHGPNHTAYYEAVYRLGDFYRESGMLPEAEELYQQALEGYRSAIGSHQLPTVLIYNNLGRLYSYQGRMLEAETMLSKALRGKRQVLGPGHASTQNTINNLGEVYHAQGKYVKAEEMFRVALSGNEELFGPYHSSTMRAVRSLEAMYRSEGRLEMADRMSQRASEASDILIRRSEPSLSRSGLDGVRTKRLLEPIIKIA